MTRSEWLFIACVVLFFGYVVARVFLLWLP